MLIVCLCFVNYIINIFSGWRTVGANLGDAKLRRSPWEAAHLALGNEGRELAKGSDDPFTDAGLEDLLRIGMGGGQGLCIGHSAAGAPITGQRFLGTLRTI